MRREKMQGRGGRAEGAGRGCRAGSSECPSPCTRSLEDTPWTKGYECGCPAIYISLFRQASGGELDK